MAVSFSRIPEIITCKAAVCWGVEEELKVEEIQVCPPNAGEVRIKIQFASICHTDITLSKGFPLPVFPRVLGHEGVGVVESVGDGVTNVSVEDLVIPTYIGECGECENCLSNKTNICLRYCISITGLMAGGTSRMSVGGQKLYHALSCATWSEYTVVDANYIVKVDPRIYLPHASLLSCGFSTGFGAAWKEAPVKSGSSVVVLGLGGVGLGAVEGARKHGASRIIGVDINELRREKGICFGMTDFINPNDTQESSISDSVKKLTGGAGVDYSFECSGVESLINEAIESTKVGVGKTILIGTGTNPSMKLSVKSMIMGRTLKGCCFGGIKIHSDIPTIVRQCINKDIPLDELCTHEIALQDISKALKLMKQPDCVKVLIKM